MKTYKLEIVGFDDKDKRLALYRLAQRCQEIANRVWQLWECWHVANDSRRKLIEALDADQAWRAADKATRGERPKFAVSCFPAVGGVNKVGNARTLRNQIEADIACTFGDVHMRVKTLLINKIAQDISTRKAANGKLAAWQAILLNHQARPTFTRPLPIPFDKASSPVGSGVVGANGELSIRLHRDEEGKSMVERFTLLTKGRAAKYIKPIARMASGEWAYKGSSLFYDGRKKKWFALLTCELPAGAEYTPIPDRLAFLRCGHYGPVQLRVGGGRAFLPGFARNKVVGVIRRQLLTQRWSRQSNYRVAGSSNKGHGRGRAIGPVMLLSRRWKDFVKRYNHTMTTAFIERCRREGVAKIMFFQPAGSGWYLDSAGKVPGREDSTGWDYFQIKTMLAYKSQAAGIEFESRKSRATKGGDES